MAMAMATAMGMGRRAPRPRPLALAALALVAGLVIGLRGADLFLPPVAFLAVAAALAAVLLDRRGLLVAATLLGVVVGGVVIGLSAGARAARDCRASWRSGARVSLTGIAIGYLPAGERGSARLRPTGSAGENGCRWSGAVRVWTEGPLRPGMVYRIEGTWQLSSRPGRWPRPPDRRGWIAARSMSALEAADPRRHPFLFARGALAEQLWELYPRRWAPLVQALVLGQRETIDPEVSRRIARAGLAHLLAISGLHVGMLAAALFALARVARAPSRSAYLITVAGTFGYVALIGAPASAVRAGLMVLLWTLTRLAARASSAFDVLGLTAVLLLLARPWSALEPGFQLSFAGAAAVGYVRAESLRSTWLRERSALVRGVAVSILASAATVLLIAPISAAHFGRVTPAAIIGNLAAVPLLGLAMPALFLSALTSPWPALASWPGYAAVTALQALDALARLLGELRWGSLEIARPALLPSLAYVCLLVLGAHALYGAWQRRRFILALGFLVAVAVAWPAVQARNPMDHLSVYVLDVGQGDAIAIATPRRHWLLVDAGPRSGDFDAGARRVVPFLREQGTRRLVAWLASHPDQDHVGGAPALLSAIDVDRVIGSGRISGQAAQIDVLRWIADNDGGWLAADAGDTLSVDDVSLVFLHPGRIVPESDETSNAYSLVFRLEYGGFRMLFTGDAPAQIEDRLCDEDADAVRAQILKVSHHGSSSSTSRHFLSRVQPELAVISAGRRNLYGHPSPRVLLRLAARGIPTRRTDREGTLAIDAWPDGSWRVRSAADGGW
ncbi:MAG: DNA internalization-related competence protein ComEC/Rec2 [Gemmatimonadales bacterium]|jgi:competence protein ComEC